MPDLGDAQNGINEFLVGKAFAVFLRDD